MAGEGATVLEIVPKSAARDPGVVRSPLTRPLLFAVALVVPVMALVVGFGLWIATVNHWFPAWQLDFLAGFGALLTIGVTGLIVLGSSNLGMSVSDWGIVVYERTPRAGKAVRRSVAWTEMRNPDFPGALPSGEVMIRTDGPSITLSYAQARTVLDDARCPLKGRLPPRVARKLGLESR
ncbi:MAG: hypothetical protein L3K03_00485 [Thermoplasmata archaeon]|nr:hypothetical protein [Thermoplasmata archaeon]